MHRDMCSLTPKRIATETKSVEKSLPRQTWSSLNMLRSRKKTVHICFGNGMRKSQVQGENGTSHFLFLQHPLLSAASLGTKHGRSVHNYHSQAQYLLGTPI